MKRASAELPLAASISALEKVLEQPRNVLIGVPGIGKSTFLEWVQLQLASADVELVSGGQQAIPLLLRVRQLDTGKLPIGAVLIEKATASPDRARIMPRGWIDRQVTAGRAFFMIDGLDEIDPGLREQQLIPWVRQLCESYPDCRFLISSRPLGYTRSSLEGLGFHESELQDFDDPQITEFTRHWCTAVRLARNEPQDEARREGGRDGDRIVGGFKENPYVRDLAQTRSCSRRSAWSITSREDSCLRIDACFTGSVSRDCYITGTRDGASIRNSGSPRSYAFAARSPWQCRSRTGLSARPTR